MYFIYLATLILGLSSSSLWALSINEKELLQWEKDALLEVEKHKTNNPEKEFLLYMIAGRELASYGQKDKALHYYQLAFEHPSASDKTEAVVQLVTLNQENKKELKKALTRAQTWFKKNPTKETPEIKRWLAMLEGFVSGKTPYENQGYHTIWAIDKRIDELMKEGKAQEALKLLGPIDPESANINELVRYDLLGAAALGKKASPPLLCLNTLRKYPTSHTWTMKVCRFLDDWKEERKSKESISSIKEQFKKENPERLFWMKLLEQL